MAKGKWPIAQRRQSFIFFARFGFLLFLPALVPFIIEITVYNSLNYGNRLE